jgi:hypothetical protein
MLSRRRKECKTGRWRATPGPVLRTCKPSAVPWRQSQPRR